MRFYFYILLFLCGCAKVTQQDLGTCMEASSAISSTTTAALLTPFFEEGHWPRENWWNMFHDPDLESCILEGLSCSPEIQTAFSNVQLACQIARQKKSSLFPFLSFFAENDYQHISKDDLDRFPPSQIPAVINQIELSLNLTYEFDFWGKNRSIYRASLGDARASFIEYQQAKIMLSLSIAKAYFDIQFLEEKKRLLETLVSYFGKVLDLTTLRLTFGLDTQIQQREAEIKKLEVEKELVNVQKDLSLSWHLLKFLMGRGPDDPLEIDLNSHIARPFFLPGNIQLDLVGRRPDLMAQIWRVQSFIHLIKAAKAAFFPNVELNATGGLLSLSYDKLFNPSNFSGSLAPAVHLPIFTGGLLSANLGARRAEYDIAVSTYNNMVLDAAREVADGIDSLKYIQKELQIQKKSFENSVINFDLIFTTYQEGISNYLDVLYKKEKVVLNQIAELTLKYAGKLGTLNLIKALGGGYSTDECADF